MLGEKHIYCFFNSYSFCVLAEGSVDLVHLYVNAM
jgi:hypothetical protein